MIAVIVGRKVNSRYVVKMIVTPIGERLPMLVERETAVPCEVALRWSVLDRRGHMAASTMADDLRAVQKFYDWADLTLDESLDTHLVEWRGFSSRQIYSLAQYVKTSGDIAIRGSIGATETVLSPGAFNHSWRKIELFLRWAAQMYAKDEYDRHGQQRTIIEARNRIERLFRQHRVGEPLAGAIRVLADEEWEKVRYVVGVEREDVWADPSIRFRNSAMVYLAINTGLRIGEMLKLALNQVPRGHEEHIVVKRNPDDPNDSRIEEPQVKTNERELFLPEPVSRMLGTYITRHRPRSTSPFVFLAQGGEPLSLRGSRHIVEQISRVSSVHLTWHRFRHTYLDRLYESLSDRPNRADLLREIAGWRSESSAKPYVSMARRREANQFLADYQGALFPPPNRLTSIAEYGV